MKLIAEKLTSCVAWKAVLHVRREETDKGLAALLRRKDQWHTMFTEGELANFSEFLRQRGLLSGDRITEIGLRVLKTNRDMKDEYGLFELISLDEPVLGKYLLAVTREDVENPGKGRDEFDNDEFPWVEHAESQEWLSWNDGKLFTLKFLTGNSTPLLRWEREISLKYHVTSEPATEANLLVTSDKENNLRHEEKIGFDFFRNLSGLLDRWKNEYEGYLLSFDELNDEEIHGFHRTMKREDVGLELKGNRDPGPYRVVVENVPLLPETKTDGIKWVTTLICEKVLTYTLKKNILMMFDEIVRTTPIHRIFPELSVDEENVIDLLEQRDQNAAFFVQVAEDLPLAPEL